MKKICAYSCIAALCFSALLQPHSYAHATSLISSSTLTSSELSSSPFFTSLLSRLSIPDAGIPGMVLYQLVFIPNYLIWLGSPFIMYRIMADNGLIISLDAL